MLFTILNRKLRKFPIDVLLSFFPNESEFFSKINIYGEKVKTVQNSKKKLVDYFFLSPISSSFEENLDLFLARVRKMQKIQEL